MYFQKLEEIIKIDKYSKFETIIEALDTWLVLIPRSYIDRIAPENFARAETLPLEYVQMIFEELKRIGFFKYNYFIRCPKEYCNHVVLITTEMKEITKYIKNHNENQYTCNVCESYSPLTTDNVFFVYKLNDTPQGRYDSKKKDSIPQIELSNSSLSITSLIIKNPRGYEKDVIDILPEVTKKQISHIIDD